MRIVLILLLKYSSEDGSRNEVFPVNLISGSEEEWQCRCGGYVGICHVIGSLHCYYI